MLNSINENIIYQLYRGGYFVLQDSINHVHINTIKIY